MSRRWNYALHVTIPALLLAGCCGLPPRLELSDLPHREGVYLELLDVDEDPEPPDDWSADVRIYEKTAYDVVIQVIHLEVDDGLGGRTPAGTVVEAFKLDDGRQAHCHYDGHDSEYRQYRWMELYPGRVSGAHWSPAGFAMLASNELGVPTDTGSSFNSDHVAKYGISGTVTQADRSKGCIWILDALQKPPKVSIPAAARAK